MDLPRTTEDYERAFRHLRQHGLLDDVLALVKLHQQEAELNLRAQLLEGEILDADNRTRAELYRLQGGAAKLAQLMTIMRTLAKPPPAEE